MTLQRLILTILVSLSFITISHAEGKKAIKGFSGGMMVHSGYQYGGDNPYNLNISSPTFGIGGCAKLHLSKHSGMIMPPIVFSSAGAGSTSTLSANGLIFILIPFYISY